MIRIVNKNILDAFSDFKDVVVCHQVNCFTMGAGVAKALYLKYPDVKIQHKRKINSFVNFKTRKELLGEICIAKTGMDNKYICNMFAQYYYGRNKKYCYTDYKAFKKCLSKIEKINKNMVIVFPYNIGCGLAGGDWNKIYGILEEFSNNREVYLYKL